MNEEKEVITTENKELPVEVNSFSIAEAQNKMQEVKAGVLTEVVDMTADEDKVLNKVNSVLKREAMLTALKTGSLINRAIDDLGERIEKRPDEMSNADYLAFLKTLNDVQKSTKTDINNQNTPTLQINNIKTETNVTINNEELNDDEKENVKAFLAAFAKSMKQESTTDEAIDAEVVENNKGEEK